MSEQRKVSTEERYVVWPLLNSEPSGKSAEELTNDSPMSLDQVDSALREYERQGVAYSYEANGETRYLPTRMAY